MDAHCATGLPVGQDDSRQLLIGSLESTQEWMVTCPFATTLHVEIHETRENVLCSIPCKRWGCRWCGPRRIVYLGVRVEAAEPNRLITLTVNPALYESPREAYDKTRRLLADFWKLIRKEVGPVEYFRVLEVHKSGMPHYHFVVRSKYIPQHLIKRVWSELSGASIVDVRQIKKQDNVVRYVMKYLAKQTYIEWTNRRVSWSKNFFRKETKPEHVKWQFYRSSRSMMHPSEYATKYMQNCVITRKTKTSYSVDKPYCETAAMVLGVR